jgi:hypothetical protein
MINVIATDNTPAPTAASQSNTKCGITFVVIETSRMWLSEEKIISRSSQKRYAGYRDANDTKSVGKDLVK